MNKIRHLIEGGKTSEAEIIWVRKLRMGGKVSHKLENVTSIPFGCYDKLLDSNHELKKNYNRMNRSEKGKRVSNRNMSFHHQGNTKRMSLAKCWHMMNHRKGLGVGNKTQVNFEAGLRLNARPKSELYKKERSWYRYQGKDRNYTTTFLPPFKQELQLKAQKKPLLRHSGFDGRHYPQNPKFNPKLTNICASLHLSAVGQSLPKIQWVMSLRGLKRLNPHKMRRRSKK